MSPRPELNAARAADFEESPQTKIKRLERTLSDERKFAVRSTRHLHKVLVRDLRQAERAAAQAERRATQAEKRAEDATFRAQKLKKRAERAEAELAILKSSTTWKAGRAVVAVPAKVKNKWGRR